MWFVFFFFKQKTAYEMRISDWSSDVCSSDLKWVIAITYTHRAAEEIEERIERLGVDTDRLWIGTIHSFCLDWILRPYGLYHEALRHGFRIVDQHEEIGRASCRERLCQYV